MGLRGEAPGARARTGRGGADQKLAAERRDRFNPQDIPQRLKPGRILGLACGTAEARALSKPIPLAVQNSNAMALETGVVCRLTHLANSRRLNSCEGCGSSCLPYRIIFPENSSAADAWRCPALQVLEIEAKPWQITYRRSSAPARLKPEPK